MEIFPLLSDSARLVHAFAFPAGLGLIAFGLWMIWRKSRANEDGAGSGPASVPWFGALVIAAVPCTLGIGLLWMPYQFVRSVALTDDAFELRYLWPRSPVRYAGERAQRVLLVESCHYDRSGWSTRSSLEITLQSGVQIVGLEASRERIVAVAERLAAVSNVAPTYEVRNAELAAGACHTESPWPDRSP